MRLARVTAQVAARVFGLAIGALVQAARVHRDDLHEVVLADLRQLQARAAALAPLCDVPCRDVTCHTQRQDEGMSRVRVQCTLSSLLSRQANVMCARIF